MSTDLALGPHKLPTAHSSLGGRLISRLGIHMNLRDRILTTVGLVLLLLGLAVVHMNWSLAPLP